MIFLIKGFFFFLIVINFLFFKLKQRVIRTEDGLKIAKDLDISFLEISSQSKLNVENIFKEIAIYSNLQE